MNIDRDVNAERAREVFCGIWSHIHYGYVGRAGDIAGTACTPHPSCRGRGSATASTVDVPSTNTEIPPWLYEAVEEADAALTTGAPKN